MDNIIKENATIRHYAGLIRELEARNKDLTARVKKLEQKLAKIPENSPTEPTNMELFSGDDINRQLSSEGDFGGGLTDDEIKALIINWINNGQLPISLHDHTDDEKGGDAYANKGSALQ